MRANSTVSPAHIERTSRPGPNLALPPGTSIDGSVAEWNALAGGMLEWQVEQLTGQQLSAASRERLVTELARLREASLALQEAPSAAASPAAVREQLMQTLALVEADRAFERELGMNVSEFLNQANSDAIEQVPSAPGAP